MTPVTPNRKLKIFIARVKIWRRDKRVYMRVLDQGIGAWGGCFHTEGNLVVESCEYPQLTRHSIFLRGTDTASADLTASEDFTTKEAAENYLQDCKHSLRTVYI